ncbi:hypothetical protein GQ55_7G250400 [Panicum hallii var. hallii]|uniref:DUF1618 domain-containing protein n=1 Tax=Panicum hallii var. hallii TaxID=1504633 RepID=A0A2T7CYV5_9POAL|nr:hypothetical protein GQ55_7G250400 [Panicum hallii var. hallii]
MSQSSARPSLCPPRHGHPPDGGGAPPPSWVLLDLHAYVADRENVTSAYGTMSNGEAIWVTFCTAPPPLVSYICVWCPNLPPTKLVMEPTIEAAEVDLVHFRVSLRAYSSLCDYFAPSGGKGPSLSRLEKPDRYLPYGNCIALLAQREIGCIHLTAKTITLGEGGLLGFADAWRGILVCDILGRKPEHYLPLPEHLIRLDKLHDEPLLLRDVAFVKGRLTLVEMRRSAPDPDSSSSCQSWDVSTWNISSPWEGQDGWRMDYMISTRNITVDENTANVDLLPKLQDNGGTPKPSLGRLGIAHPTLSLSDSHVVYLMGKAGDWDKKTLVLYVDMRNERLQGVAVFDLRIHSPGSPNRSAWFQELFCWAQVSSNLKRPGKFQMLYPRKLQTGVGGMDDMVYEAMQLFAQEQHDAGPEDGDNDMALD